MKFEEWITKTYSANSLDAWTVSDLEAAWDAATCNANLQLGRCDQYKNEALAMRKALGFSADSENVAPIDLLNKLEEVVNSKLTPDHIANVSKMIPEGYVLVPAEPTLDMIKAAYRLTHDHFGVELLYAPEDIYKAMIQAAQEEE